MKKIYSHYLKTFLLLSSLGLASAVYAQQLPDPGFEDWSGTAFDGKKQLKSWNGSNVQKTMVVTMRMLCTEPSSDAHSGSYSYHVHNSDEVVGNVSPGYGTLGHPWTSNMSSLGDISTATAGTYGGISFKYRPDAMKVWIKRTGSNATNENFNIVFYSWKGTSKGTSYRAKNYTCNSSTVPTECKTDEESDIRQALDKNQCVTNTYATQIAEGWIREKKTYNNWTQITIPIYYLNSETPDKVNVIFSAGNYPNFRDNDGIYAGNALFVDDVELVYNSNIEDLYIDGIKWGGFNPNTSEEQVYSLGNDATEVPDIYGMRGKGTISNDPPTHGDFAGDYNAMKATVNFPGRRLSDSEMTITKGKIGEVTTITVKAEDGSSTTTYKIRFVKAASTNAVPQNITYTLAGETKTLGFSGTTTSYNVSLPYGTTAVPQLNVTLADGQTMKLTQPTSVNGTGTVVVTAADGKTTKTYTVNFSVEKLTDTQLVNILVNGDPIPGFEPTKKNYTFSSPVETEPVVTPVSAYADGEQTIKVTTTKTADGYKITINVSAPGASTAREYVITYKIEKSSNKYLAGLSVPGYSISPTFSAATRLYTCALPLGVTSRPDVEYTKGDSYQTVTVAKDNDNVEGVTSVTVTAGDGTQYVYTVTFSVAKSSNNKLKAIYVNGNAVENFSPDNAECSYVLPIGTTTYPTVTWEQGDEYQTVNQLNQNLNGVNNIQVTAGDGTQFIYKLTLSVAQADNTYLNMIYVGGAELTGFLSTKFEYSCVLPSGTTALPSVTYTKGDEYQTVTARGRGVNGDYVITVVSQAGSSQTYTIHFSVASSDNTALSMIYYGGTRISDFAANKYEYTVTLAAGVTTIPRVTADKGETSQTMTITQGNPATVKVTAQSGATATYTINFVLQQLSSNTQLNDIKVGGQTIDGFSASTYEYSVVLPKGTTTLPAVTYTKGEESQTVTERNNGVNGDYVLTVRSATGDYQNYVIHFSVVMSANCNLDMIYLDGTALTGFTANTTDYNVTLPEGTTAIPAVTFDKAEDEQTVTPRNKTSRGTGDYLLTVKAENGTTKVYTLHFSVATVEKSDNAKLQMIYLDGEAMSEFAQETYEYWRTLPQGTATLPTITWLQGDDEQEVTLTGPTTSGKYTIRVKAGNGTIQNYYVTLAVERASDVNLKSISVDGILIDGFSSSREDYTYVLPADATIWPEVTYEKNDDAQTVTTRIRESNGTGTYQLVVTSESGDSRTYTITFTKALSKNTQLEMIYLDGISLEGFDATQTEYTVTLQAGVTIIPQVSALRGESSQRLTIEQGNPAKITVTAEDGTQQVYTLNFNLVLSDNANLSMIYLDGVQLTGFNSSRTNYDVVIASPVCPVITVDKGEEHQQVSISAPASYGTATIVVTAQAGNTQTYEVNLLSSTGGVLQLTDIYVDGVALSGFDPSVYEYYDVEYSTEKPVITATADAGLIVTVLTNCDLATITVASQTTDNNSVYLLHLVPADKTLSNNAELTSVTLSEGELTFDPSQDDYYVTLPVGSNIPVVTYTKAEERQTVVAGLTSKNTYVLKVTAENGISSKEYTINFNIPEADCTRQPRLSVLKVNGSVVAGFSQEIFNYTVPQNASRILDYTLADGSEDAIVVFSEPDKDKQQILLQRRGCSETVVYTVTYQNPLHTSATLGNIMIDGLTPAFQPLISEYNVTLPVGTAAIPCINVATGEDGQVVTIAYGKPDGGEAKIHVVSEDGLSQFDYTVHYTLLQSSDATLADISIEGVADYEFSPAFSPAINDYTVLLKEEGTTGIPVLKWSKMNVSQQVELAQAPLGEVSTLKVTAEDGTVNTYNLRIINVGEHTNQLVSITIDGVGELALGSELTKTVELPFGTTEFKITDVKKTYNEQTVFITNGGLLKPTKILVRSNNNNVADTEYTITPNLATRDHTAMLSGITVDGTEIENFTPEQFSYIVNVTSQPEIAVTASDGVVVTESASNSKMKKYTVTENGVSNTYSIYFFYENDTVPNWNFDGEVVSTKYMRGVKPKGWNAPDDFVAEGYTGGLGITTTTFYTGQEVSVSNGIVILNSVYSKSGIGGTFPGMMTLGSMNITLAGGRNAGVSPTGTQSSIVGPGISFRNTPQSATIRYNAVSATRIDNIHLLFEFRTTSSGTVKSYTYTDSSYDNTWKTRTVNFNNNYDVPQYLNITLNAAQTENAYDINGTYWNEAKSTLYIDYVKFDYNSKLSSVTVDGNPATISGTNITYEINDAEYHKVPALTFTGEVEDQMHVVEWTDGINHAVIHNYAEDGSVTDYNLTITRPQSSISTLSDILVNGASIGTNTSNAIQLGDWTGILPDVQVIPGSVHQTIQFTQAGDTLTYLVTAENGDETTYRIIFTDEEAGNTSLASLTTGDGSSVTLSGLNYNITLTDETLPDLYIQKASNSQTVECGISSIKVTSQDGTETIYNVHYQLPDASGRLYSLTGDGFTFTGATEYKVATLPAATCFVREFSRDSVFQTITQDSITWKVISILDESQSTTYKVVKSDNSMSDNAQLADIQLNGASVAASAFDPYTYNWVLTMPDVAVVTVVKQEEGQKVDINSAYDLQGNLAYTLTVTSPSTIVSNDYKLTLKKPLSGNTELKAVMVNGTALADFAAGKYDYSYQLPLADATLPKTEHLALTSIDYIAENGQQVYVDMHGVGATSYIEVTADDGSFLQYTLNVTEEPSHYALLSNITVNGLPVASAFDPVSKVYTVTNVAPGTPEIKASTVDCFVQDIQIYADASDNDVWYVEVTAEDGVTKAVYTLKLIRREVSHDPFLAEILLDGLSFTDYASTGKGYVTPSTFNRYNTYYTIELTSKEKPVVSVTTLGTATVTATQTQGDSVLVSIMAEDLVETLTYVIYMKPYKSNDVAITDITIDGKSMSEFGESFSPSNTLYQIVLPADYSEYPLVDAVYDADLCQTVTVIPNATGDITKINVMSEDREHERSYTVLLQLTPSSADTLFMIYENGLELPGFNSQTTLYNRTLPVGTRSYPRLEAVLDIDAEGLTTVQAQTLYEEAYQACYQFLLTAENGSNNIYTINYNILKSGIDTLQMLYVDGMELADFSGSKFDYQINLQTGDVFPGSITWLAGDEWQSVTARENLSQDGYSKSFDVTAVAENGASNTYHLQYTLQKSAADTLIMIYADGVEIEGFEPHKFTYNITLPVGTTAYPLLEGMTEPDVAGKTMVEESTVSVDDYRATYQIKVTAENGSINIYTVNFTICKSSINNLVASNPDYFRIYENSVLLPGFDKDVYSYTRRLPVGTRQYPHLEGVVATEMQGLVSMSMDTVYYEPYQAAFRFVVNAQDGSEISYMVSYKIMLSDVNTLNSIYEVGGGDIEGFVPTTFNYDITMPMGVTSFPQLDYEQGDEWQNVVVKDEMLSGGMARQTTMKVTAEDGSSNVYIVTYHISLSEADTLLMIYENGTRELQGFSPTQFVYDIKLPSGTTAIPVITDEDCIRADEWQTVVLGKTDISAYQTRYEILVTAGNGNSSMYIINYEILKSECDTLQLLLVDSKMIDGFVATNNDYYVTLPHGTTELPQIDYIKGDEMQQVTVKSNGVNGITFVTVTAESGASRTYTISFNVALSDNTALNMIQVAGVSLSDFEKDVTEYTVDILSPWTALPAVNFEKAEAGQNVTVIVDGLVVTIHVLAEDGVSERIYTVTFHEVRSSNAELLAVYFDGERFYEFNSKVYEYHFPVDYTVTERPEITWLLSENEQTAYLESTSPLSAIVHVIAADGTEEEYAFYFDRELCYINWLEDILINGESIGGFHKDTLVYSVEWAVGTAQNAQYGISDIDFVKAEMHEAVEVTIDEDYTIVLHVQAEDGTSRNYLIYQTVLLSDEAYLKDILIGGYSLHDFDSATFEYTYLLLEGEIIPTVEPVVPSDDIQASVTLGSIGEATNIYCIAPNGRRVTYSVLFQYSETNTAVKATERDVLLRHVPGTRQFMAYTTRQNVQVALYDMFGTQLKMLTIPVCNPNMTVMGDNTDDQEFIYNVFDNANGVTFEIPDDRMPFFYVFYYNYKERLKSGKIMLNE